MRTKDGRGSTAVEYALLVGFGALVCAFGVELFGSALVEFWQKFDLHLPK